MGSNLNSERRTPKVFASRAFSFAVVIRCLLRPSNELRRAMETLNRYIDGERKRDQTTDLRGYREFVTRNTVSSRIRSLAVGRIAGGTPAATVFTADTAATTTLALMHRKPLTIDAWEGFWTSVQKRKWEQSSLLRQEVANACRLMPE